MKKIIILILLTLPIAFASAQFGRMGKMNEEHRAAALEKIENYRKLRMVEVLKLNEETSVKLIARYTKHREAVRNFEKDRMAVVDKLETLLASNSSDADYNKAFNELNEIEKKMYEARSKYLTEIKEILTAKQVAEYLVFERNFMRDIREIARDIQQNRKEK